MIASPKEWYNVLESDEEKFRAIVALGVGYDVLPSGVKGVGIDTLAKWVKIHGKKYDCFIEEYIKKPGISSIVLDEYIDTILFEPGNYIGDGSDTKFIFSRPTRLGNFCSDYDVMIPKKDTCELLECCGINGVVHQFMELEDYNVCEMCNKIVCSYCLAKLNEKKEEKCNQKHLCVECYNLSINVMKESNEASISQQRMILKDNHNIHDINDLSILLRC